MSIRDSDRFRRITRPTCQPLALSRRHALQGVGMLWLTSTVLGCGEDDALSTSPDGSAGDDEHDSADHSTAMSVAALGDLRSFIERNLQNEQLSVQWIADNFGCCKRTIQRRFEAAFGQTVTRFVLRARLEQCARELPRCTSLTELAHSYGFCSSAHFSRAFRAHFGTSPSAFEAGHQS